MSSLFHRRQQHWGPLAAVAGSYALGEATKSADESRNPYEITGINAEQAVYDRNQGRVGQNVRAIDEGAFGPIFGQTATTLDARSFGADATGARNLGTGVGAQQESLRGLQDARAAVANTSTAGLANAAQIQGQSAQMLGRDYMGGNDPSVAQQQLQAGTDQALRAQLAAARSGGNPAAAYQAQLMGASTMQTAANQAAQLRAQERQAARGDMLAAERSSTDAQGNLLNANIGRGQALAGIASTQAGVGQSVAGLGMQQQLRADALTGQASGLREQDAQRRVGLEAARSQETAAARNYVLGLGSQGIQQQGVALQAGDQADRRAAVRDAKTGAMIQGVAGGVQQMYDAGKDDGGGDSGGFGYEMDPDVVNSDERSKAKIRKLEAENSLLKGSADDGGVRDYLAGIGDTDEDIASENAFLARYDSGPQRPAYDSAQTAGGLVDPWGASAPQYRAPPPEAYASPFAPLGAQWATSDERAKSAVDEMHAKAPAKTFEYRPGYGPPGRREGVMADDLERSELGRSLVSRDPATGMRRVDTPQLTMANTAEISLLRNELQQLKAGRR
jgi:hypothetical protein